MGVVYSRCSGSPSRSPFKTESTIPKLPVTTISTPGQGTKIPHAMGQIKPMSHSEDSGQLKKKKGRSAFIFHFLTADNQRPVLSSLGPRNGTPSLASVFKDIKKAYSDANALDAMVGIPSDQNPFLKYMWYIPHMGIYHIWVITP